MPSGELADALDRRQNDLYHHLDVLEDAGLVGKFREESSRVYELSPLAAELVPGLFDSIRARADVWAVRATRRTILRSSADGDALI